MSNVETDREGVNQALARLLAWPEVARSPQLANFLSYIVEKRLNGDAQAIKAYSIAVDVFGRPPNFDPQADPIVRVQARRLRGLLDQYYRGPGADESVRIDLPIGRYVPEFVDVDTEPVSTPIGIAAADAPDASLPPQDAAHPHRKKGHVTLSWFVLLVLAIGATALTYSLATLGPRQPATVAEPVGAMDMPQLRILEFQNLTGDTSLAPTIAALAVELVTDFEPLLIVDVVFGGRGNVTAEPEEPDDFVLSGVVRQAPNGSGYIQFNAILTDAHTNTVVWNWSGSIPNDEIARRGGVDYVSQELILRLGGPRGPLHASAREFLARSSIEGQENFYLCGVMFSMYRTVPSAGMTSRLDSCLAALPSDDQANGNVIAARASLLAEAMPDGNWSGEAQQERIAQAEQMLAEALKLSPTSSFIWEQRARLHEAMGQHEEAESAYGTAMQLNTANIDGAAAHARHMALIGLLESALPLAQRAIDAVPSLEVPKWFQCVPALAALEQNAFQRAQRLALDCGRVDTELGPVISLLVADGTGDAALIGQTLPRLLEVPTFRSAGIMTRLNRRMTDDVLLAQIEQALLNAGVPVSSLVDGY